MSVDVLRLLSCYPDGRPYTREPEIEEALKELHTMSLDELMVRCQIDSPKVPGYVPSECIVHFLRQHAKDNRDARYNRFYRLFRRRVVKALPRAERQEGAKLLVDAAISDANDAAHARIDLLVTLDREGGRQLDFYEVHFNQAVALLRLSARRASARNARREVAIEHDPETGELPPLIERAAGSLDELDDNIFFDPIFRPRLLAAIESLQPEQKEVISMLMCHIPAEAKDPAQPSISAILARKIHPVEFGAPSFSIWRRPSIPDCPRR